MIPDYPLLDSDSNPTGETIPGADMIDWKNWAPRLGFAWQPTGDGRTVVRGFAGLFWDSPVSSAWYAPSPGRSPSCTYFTYPWQYQTGCVPVAPADELLDPNTESPHTWQYALSFDQQLGDDYAFGIQLNRKKAEDIIGFQIEDDGAYTPFTYVDWMTGDEIELWMIDVQPTRRKGNSPGPGSMAAGEKYHIDYKSAIATFRKRYSNGWDLMASYTWSKTEGINPRPHDAGSLGQGLPGFTADTGSDPNDWYNAGHLLQGDRTHMFRIQSNVDIGWDLRLSGVLNVQSGRPYLPPQKDADSRADVDARRVDRHGRCAEPRWEVVAEHGVGCGAGARFADADADAIGSEGQKAPSGPGEGGHGAPEGEADGHQLSPDPDVGQPSEWNAEDRVENREGGAVEETELSVGQSNVRFDLLCEYGENIAVDKVEDVDERQNDKHVLRVGAADFGVSPGIGLRCVLPVRGCFVAHREAPSRPPVVLFLRTHLP